LKKIDFTFQDRFCIDSFFFKFLEQPIIQQKYKFLLRLTLEGYKKGLYRLKLFFVKAFLIESFDIKRNSAKDKSF